MNFQLARFLLLMAIPLSTVVFAKEKTTVKVVTESLVNAPVDQETCFSPDEPCDVKLVKFIESAEKSIDLAVYDVTLDQVVHQILVKSKKMQVRIVVDRRQSKEKHSLVSTLIKGGANIRYGNQRGIMHDKFTIVDDKMIETGSFNYTNHATKSNQENQVYLSNSTIVERYRTRFDKIWSTATVPQ